MKYLLATMILILVLIFAVEGRGAKKASQFAKKASSAASRKKGGKSSGGQGERHCSRRAKSNAGDMGAQIGGKIGGKIAGKVASAVAGPIGGAALGGITLALGFIGDAVQRDKCKLRCCPDKGLPGSWACKYQPKSKCDGFYSDYPGHGDHACWWNEAEGRCEAGIACRDKTFSFFALVGSLCPPCPDEPCTEPQFNKAALKNLDMPVRFYVDPRDEYAWCSPKGVPSCYKVKSKSQCEIAYADHKGDKNCVWRTGKCFPGPKCDNARERVEAAKKLGLKFAGSTWRRNGVPLTGSASDYNHNKNRGIGV